MNHAIRLAVAGTVLLVAAVAGWTLGGGRADADQSRAQIEAKSQAERDRVKRAYEEYRSLPPSERAAVQKLHESVARDPGLEQILLGYEGFLATLGPAEREELRQEADEGKRIAKVEGIVAERESRGRRWFASRFVEGPVLQPPQLDQAAMLVLDALGLSASEKEKLLAAAPEEHVRHLQIMRLAKAKVQADSARDQDRFREPGRSREKWPDDATVREILKLHPDDEFRERLMTEDEAADPGRREWQRGFRRTVALGLLGRSLLAEWHAVAFRVVDQKVLHQAFEQIPQEERNKLAEGHPGELVRAALLKAITTRDDDLGKFGKDFQEVVAIRDQLDPWPNRRGPPPPFVGAPRGNRGGDGRRGGFDRGPGQGGPGREGPGRGPDRDRGGPNARD